MNQSLCSPDKSAMEKITSETHHISTIVLYQFCANYIDFNSAISNFSP